MIIINGKFLAQKMTGVQRFAREICNELDTCIKPNQVIIAIPPNAFNVPSYKNIKIVKIGICSGLIWEQIIFPIYVRLKNGISLNLCNTAPLIRPDFVFIYDMKPLAHPEFFNKLFIIWYRIQFLNSTKRARLIFTDSKFAKREILKYYSSISEKKIHVIYPGWQHYERIAYDEDTLNRYNLQKNEYYFAISSMDPNKNFKWIASRAILNPSDTFVIAGGVNKSVFNIESKPYYPQNMQFIGYISDEEAKTLMRDCKGFLFPSIYEGFGLPPLEAMSVGANSVIVSDIPVMHEVFNNTVNYIINIDEKNNSNNTIISSSNNANKNMILSRYSWKRSAYKLLNTINTQI